MTKMLRILLAALISGLCCFPALAQGSADDATTEESSGDEPVTEVNEVLVVTASRTEQKLHDVPATITVLTSEDIENAPADDYGDLLRNVPGVNVSQISARDIQVSSREATGSLSTGQLVLVDGRTLYLDFFGFVMWDFLPINTSEIKQIEVVQGPGSAVWGANATKGVINVITKSPRELAGTHLLLGAGELDTAYASITQAGTSRGGKLGYKVSGTYYEQGEPYDRPTGTVPGTGTPYPPFENSGTEQPKIDARIDWDSSEDTSWSVSSGWAGTDGIIHSGIGPFDIDRGSSLGYAKASWAKRAMNVTAFVNLLDGEASNLLTRDPFGNPILLGFESQTYNLDFTNTSVAGQSHILTYGVNARHNDYDLSIAPTGDNRDEYGVFLQDEILLGDKFRWLIGARWDDIDPVGSVVSPRTSLMFSPTPRHTLRVSYNKAYRAPSLIENHIDIDIVSGSFPTRTVYDTGIAPLLPFPLPCEAVLSTCETQQLLTDALGNPELTEEELEAYELGYVATFDKATFSVAIYRNETTDATDFFATEAYNPFNLPADWPRFLFPLGPTIPAGAPLFIPALADVPAVFSYRNIGELVNEGIELSLQVRPTRNWRINANYSYQETPEVTGIPEDEVNIPPENRFNFTLAYDADRFYVNGNVNYVDEAFWTDVLDSRFFGPTDDFTQVNVGVGFRFNEGRATVAILGSNVFDERVQQHVFGDVISRKITGELRFSW